MVVAHQPPPPLAAMATVGMYAKDVYGRGTSNGVITCLLSVCALLLVSIYDHVSSLLPLPSSPVFSSPFSPPFVRPFSLLLSVQECFSSATHPSTRWRRSGGVASKISVTHPW